MAGTWTGELTSIWTGKLARILTRELTRIDEHIDWWRGWNIDWHIG